MPKNTYLIFKTLHLNAVGKIPKNGIFFPKLGFYLPLFHFLRVIPQVFLRNSPRNRLNLYFYLKAGMNQIQVCSILLLFLVSACLPQGEKAEKKEIPAFSPAVISEDTACLLAEITYCSDPEAATTQYLPGWSLLWEGAEINGNHALIAGKAGTYALAIRGSLLNFSWAAFQNWVYQDLHVTSKERWPYTRDSVNARVSAGAYSGWQNLRAMTGKQDGRKLVQVLDSLLDQQNRLLITGHSLGGNLATVFGVWFTHYRHASGHTTDQVQLITFAAPAAGNRAFAEAVDQQFPDGIRIENQFDIVPKFPTAAGFQALGRLFTDSLNASDIRVGYKNVETPLSDVFTGIGSVFTLLELTSSFSPYVQPGGEGKQVTMPLSGNKTDNPLLDWLNEAAVQHSIAQYCRYEKVPVIPCAQ